MPPPNVTSFNSISYAALDELDELLEEVEELLAELDEPLVELPEVEEPLVELPLPPLWLLLVEEIEVLLLEVELELGLVLDELDEDDEEELELLLELEELEDEEEELPLELDPEELLVGIAVFHLFINSSSMVSKSDSANTPWNCRISQMSPLRNPPLPSLSAPKPKSALMLGTFAASRVTGPATGIEFR